MDSPATIVVEPIEINKEASVFENPGFPRRGSLRWPSEVARPDRIISRPEWPDKDILITSQDIFYNFTRSVDTLGDDGRYRFVQTSDFSDEGDNAAVLETIGSATKGQFWKRMVLEISVDIMQFVVYEETTGVTAILKHLRELEPAISDNVENLHVNIFLPVAQRLDTPATGTEFYQIETLRTLQRLFDKLTTFKLLKSCVICLQVPTPPKSYLDTRWLNHAIPFENLACERTVRWQIPNSSHMPLCAYDNNYIKQFGSNVHAAIRNHTAALQKAKAETKMIEKTNSKQTKIKQGKVKKVKNKKPKINQVKIQKSKITKPMVKKPRDSKQGENPSLQI